MLKPIPNRNHSVPLMTKTCNTGMYRTMKKWCKLLFSTGTVARLLFQPLEACRSGWLSFRTWRTGRIVEVDSQKFQVKWWPKTAEKLWWMCSPTISGSLTFVDSPFFAPNFRRKRSLCLHGEATSSGVGRVPGVPWMPLGRSGDL